MRYKSNVTVRELITWRPATERAAKRSWSKDKVFPTMLCKGYLLGRHTSQKPQLLKRTGNREVVPQQSMCPMPVPPPL